MTLTELSSVEAGDPLGSIRYQAGVVVVDSTFTRGRVPKSSRLAEDAETYVATDDMGRAVAAIALEHIHDGVADLGIDSRGGNIASQSNMMRSIICEAMKRSGVQVGRLDPELVDMMEVPAEDWRQVGFVPDPSGHYTFRGA